MTHIREYPEGEGLRDWMVNLWVEALDDFKTTQNIEELDVEHELEEVLVLGAWGRGDAGIGFDLRFGYVFSGTPTEESDEQVAGIINAISEHIRGVQIFSDIPTNPPGPDEEWFDNIIVENTIYDDAPDDILYDIEELLNIEFTQEPGDDVVYSITEEEELSFGEIEEVSIQRRFPEGEIPYDALEELAEERDMDIPDRSDIEPSDVADILSQPIPDDVTVPEELEGFINLPGGEITVEVEDGITVIERRELPLEPEEVEEEEPEEPEEPEEDVFDDEVIEVGDIRVNEQIDEDRGIVEVPTGKKQSTRTDYRDLYDFEIEMLAMGDGPTDLEIYEGIGQHMAIGTFGSSAPPITFPRTGVYIKNRLKHEGPAYVRELHKDLCRYAWAIVEEYRVMVRPGRYEHFRGMVNKLMTAGLIERLSSQEASQLGFDIYPRTPDGRVAYFLEQRNYYRLVEDEEDSDAWNNVTKHLYSD